jgi:hypothetical protein
MFALFQIAPPPIAAWNFAHGFGRSFEVLRMITLEQAPEIWNFAGHRHAEVRVGFSDGHVLSRFADDSTQLLEILNEFNGRANLWIGINERRQGGTKNEDVIIVRNIVLDIEPKGLKEGEYPTEEQRQACLAVVNKVREWGKEKGINTFVVDSGRGFHIWIFLSPIEINDSNRSEIAAKYKRFYDLMREQFETPEVKIDTTSDLARVIGIPYTINVKWGRERKPERSLERLHGDRSREFLLSLKSLEVRTPTPEFSMKLPQGKTELPECAMLARGRGVPVGCRDNFFYALLNALDWKFELSESDAWALIAPIAKASNFSLSEAIGKVRYHVGKGEHYEPRTLCKYAREAKLCEHPQACYWFARPVRISELCAEMIGKQVIIDGQIVGEHCQMAIPRELRVECAVCGLEDRISVVDNQTLLQDYVLKTGDPKKFVKWLFNARHRDVPCIEAGTASSTKGEGDTQGAAPKKHDPNSYDVGYVDYAVLWVRDPLEKLGLERFDKRAYESREIHLVGQTVPSAKKVKLQGRVALDQKRNIVVLAEDVKPLESEVSSFIATDADKEAWTEYFANTGPTHKEIAPHIFGAKRDIAKKIISYVYHSPPMIPDIQGRIIKGIINVAEFGDTTAGKSQTAKSLTDGSDDGWNIPLGTYVLAETGGRTGLLYTIDNDRHALIWGELVLNDLGLVVVDGLEQISPEEFSEFREAIRTGKISVRRALVGDAWVRTRLITCFNPKKPMNQYLYPCQAIADTWTFENPTNITRFDIFVPFALDDVPPAEIASGKTESRPIPPDVFAKHVFWVWSRRPEDIIYENETMEEIKNAGKEIIEAYSTQSLPIVSNESFATVCRLSVARAAERHSTDEKHAKVIVKPEHVQSAMDDFKAVLTLLGLGEYKLAEEKRLTISDNDFASICGELDKTDLKLLDGIKLKGKPSAVLAEELGTSETSVKNRYAKLKSRELIETVQRVGVSLTSKGIIFMRLLQIKGTELILEAKREGQQTLNTCEVCHNKITGAVIYAEDGTRLCQDCAKNYRGRI